MKLHATGIEGLILIEPRIFKDERGYFFESYNKNSFQHQGLDYNFVQDNESLSSYGTIRGLHFQQGEHAQAKLVRVLEGKVLDVALDLRAGSATFGQYRAFELSAENKHMLMIPRGFAHGFSVLSERALFSYKCDNNYCKESEGGIIYNDPQLAINWQVEASSALVSPKDTELPTLQEYLNNAQA